MDQLPRVRARLQTLSELRDIVRAMRAMAAGAVREGTSALPAMRRYREIMDDAVADGLMLAAGTADLPVAEPRKRLLCLIGTEHGFVGDLNQRLIHEAVRPGDGQSVFVVGRRAASIAEERGIDVAGVAPMTSHAHTVPLLARRVTEQLADASDVRVVFCRHRPDSKLSVVERQIIPIASPDGQPRHRSPPLHHLEPAALVSAFAEEYLMAEMARALTEAFVGENATRLRVLDAADHNIGDKIDELESVARQIRQETITAELLEIVVGAEAVVKAPNNAHRGTNRGGANR